MNPVATPADLTRSDARATAADLSVAVVGMGYVGLPTRIALGAPATPSSASTSPSAACRDRRRRRRSCSTTSRPSSPALGSQSLALTADPAELAAADAVIICVPDPGRRAPPARTCARCARACDDRRRARARRARRSSSPRPPRRHDARAARRAARRARPRSPARTSTSRSRPSASTRASRPTRSRPTPRVVGGATRTAPSTPRASCADTCSDIHASRARRGGRDGEALREHVPRVEHRARERVRRGGAGIYGLDAVEVIDAAQDQAVRLHGPLPAARRRRALHPGRPLLPARAAARRRRPRADRRAPSMEQVAERPGAVAASALDALDGAGDRRDDPRVLVVGDDLQAGRRRRARVRRRWRSCATCTMRRRARRLPRPARPVVRAGRGRASSRSAPSAEDYDVAVLTLVAPGPGPRLARRLRRS